MASYGGEEFVVMLPQTPLNGATIEAERIRDAVAEHCYANLMKEKITVRLGLCCYPHKGIINSGDMVNFADKALYEAKKAGKDCVKVYGEGGGGSIVGLRPEHIGLGIMTVLAVKPNLSRNRD